MSREFAERPRMLMSPEENGTETVKSDVAKPASTVVSARLDAVAMSSMGSSGMVTCSIMPQYDLSSMSLFLSG